MENTIKVTQQKYIVEVEFIGGKHNMLNSQCLKKLTQSIYLINDNHEVRAIKISSAGNRTFCSGASLEEVLALKTKEDGESFFNGFANFINACRKSPHLILGCVQGKAVGGGVGIAAAMDYCLATQHAAIRLSELSVGLGAFAIEPAVRRKIGLSGLSDLSLCPWEFQSAKWALEKGLYNKLFESQEDMHNYAQEWLQKIVNTNPEAIRQWKKALWRGTENWDELLAKQANITGDLAFSKETNAIVRKILKK